MKKYTSFFRLRFLMGMQYRIAALAGCMTQFLWGAMEIFTFRAFYNTNPEAFPMTLEATASYVWLKEAFLALYMAWFMEHEIFDSIMNGNIAYELCRPIHLYPMWFTRSLAHRLSGAVLRCYPILLVAFFLPKPLGLALPDSVSSFFYFLVSMILGLLVTVSFCMLVYALCFFTISPAGIRMVALSMVELLAGAVIPLPFFPPKIQRILELLPFGSMQNAPFRIYNGHIRGNAIFSTIGLQILWFFLLTSLGTLLMKRAMSKVIVQGG